MQLRTTFNGSRLAFHYIGGWTFDITTKRVWARLVVDCGPWRVIVK